jgi:hypothetical protein
MLDKLRRFRKAIVALVATAMVVALPLEAFAAIKLSSRVKQAMLDAIETTIGTSAHLQIWAGTIPTDCATTAVGQTKLADFALASDWAAAASTTAGTTTKVFNAISNTTGLATGNAAFYRLTDSTNPSTTCDEQGTVTATGGGGDMTMDNISIATGQTISVTGWTWTQPGWSNTSIVSGLSWKLMALTPEIDALVARINGLESLVSALDGVQPINVTIGTFSLTVDPATMPEAYTRGSDVLRNVAQSTIVDLRNAISQTAIAQSGV